jgi:hypothetical protein
MDVAIIKLNWCVVRTLALTMTREVSNGLAKQMFLNISNLDPRMFFVKDTLRPRIHTFSKEVVAWNIGFFWPKKVNKSTDTHIQLQVISRVHYSTLFSGYFSLELLSGCSGLRLGICEIDLINHDVLVEVEVDGDLVDLMILRLHTQLFHLGRELHTKLDLLLAMPMNLVTFLD